ncbi:hypothetical protein [Pasteuria penetrans]|uniref:hypothetical protein n=1 Tax=Pasteuria penetrans TaxID=86005 RepID=UPI000FBBCF15|nr:hypothetical protein [Pasteuria penetrans]
MYGIFRNGAAIVTSIVAPWFFIAFRVRGMDGFRIIFRSYAFQGKRSLCPRSSANERPCCAAENAAFCMITMVSLG